MLVYKDGRVADYRALFPTTNFTRSGPTDEFLEQNDAYKVSTFRPHDQETEKLVPCDPVVENGWAYIVKVEPKTAEEIAAYIESMKAQMRANRNRALEACDWMVIRAAETGVALDAEWAAYRQALRDLPDQEGFPKVQMPRDPNWVEPGI